MLVSAAVGAALWWQPAHEDRVVLAPAPPTANRLPSTDVASLPAPAPAAVATRAPALKLVGTVAAGAGSFATVVRTTDSQLLQLRVGDRVDGLAVTAIEADRIVLAGAAQPIVIEAQTAAAAPAAAVPSGAADGASAPRTEPPAWAEGEAPWDLAPPFRH